MKPDAAFRRRVEALVAQIPRGRVMTYGQIAALCGNARSARIVGGIAHFGDPDLPWQRVVNRSGGLASGYPGGRSGHKQILEAEGVSVSDDYKVDIDNLLWFPEKAPPLLVIVGETAGGKSKLALELARHLDGEIIAADSWTVRREADIGTAKPTRNERAEIPHHLIDVAGPGDDFTAAVFKESANQAINEIYGRGRLPIMVGGTGLYVDSVLYDYGFLPAGNRVAREELNRLSVEQLLKRMDALELDPGDVDLRNKRRLIRLIETNGAQPKRGELRPNTLVIGLRIDREKLTRNIEERVDDMLAAGLENEVKGLAERYGWECEVLKGVGYAQWQGYFEGQKSLPEVRQDIIKATLDLAKRQRTWFKRNSSIQWLDTPVNWHDVVEMVTTKLISKSSQPN